MSNQYAFAGSLDFLNVGDLIQQLGNSGSTGTLKITSNYSEYPGYIYFQKGNPVNAKCGSTSALDAIFALFGWKQGEFQFTKGQIDEPDVIRKSRMELVLEGTRLLDEGEISIVGPLASEKKTTDTSGVPVVKGPLVDYMYIVDEEEYLDSQTVVKQGKHGQWIWVILDGILEIRKETTKGPFPIIRMGQGSFLGSVAAFLMHGNVRSCTAVAVGKVNLGVLDSQRLSREYACFERNFRRTVMSLDKRLKQATNRVAEIHLGKKVSYDFIKEKSLFIKQGENTNKSLVIEQGAAYVVRETANGPVLLARIEENDFIGRVPFMNIGQEPHSASIYTSEDITMRELDVEALQMEFDQMSTTFKNMVENTSASLSATSTVAAKMYEKQFEKKKK